MAAGVERDFWTVGALTTDQVKALLMATSLIHDFHRWMPDVLDPI
jgi:hypothetical protein